MPHSDSLPPARTILDVLRQRAAVSHDHLAYDYNGDERTSFSDLYLSATAMAHGLAAQGLSGGEYCAVITPMHLDQVRLVYAIQLAGAAPVLLDPASPPGLLLRRLSQCRPRLIVAAPEICKAFQRDMKGLVHGALLVSPEHLLRDGNSAGSQLPEVSSEDTAYLQFTSGTTGEPKIVVITHRNLIEYVRIHTAHVGLTQDDIFLSWTPLFHDLGLVGFVFLSLYIGCPSHLLPPQMASLGVWLQTASKIRATVISGPDFGYRIVTRSVNPVGLDLSSVRMSGSGGEPVRLDTLRRFEERFGLHGTSVGGYGQAEAVMCISMGIPGETLRVDESANVANGRVLPELEIRIVDENGSVLQPGEVGEITARGPTIFNGYLDDPEVTRQTLRDGWLFTGDNGYLDSEGYLFILGRKKALIKRGGCFIPPREVEMAADRIPAVRYSAAVGVPSASIIASEDLVLVAEVQPEAVDSPQKRDRLIEAIIEAVDQDTGHAPSEVILAKPRTIPRTANGKIRYGELRELVANGKLISIEPWV